MRHDNAENTHTTYSLLLIACVAALAVVFMVSRPQPVYADDIVPPAVPFNLQVPAGNEVFLKGAAVGTQNYICLPSGTNFVFTLFTPEATLFNDDEKQIITHFFSPNPDENGTIRATWQHSRDTSTVWAMTIASSTDPNFVAAGAIPWLLLEVVGTEPGPTGGDRLTRTTFIQRLNTSGGIAPSIGCAQSADIGKTAFVPYTADYFFYKAAKNRRGRPS